MSGLRVAVTGAAGRMGRTVLQACRQADVQVAGAVEAAGHPHIGTDAGVLAGSEPSGLLVVEDLGGVLGGADGCIDFTHPDATLRHVAVCRERAKPIVIGTTGFTSEQRDGIERAAKSIPIVLAPNMSVGVNVLFKLVGLAARTLGDDFDVEIIEAHHRGKVDAPSGTACRIGEILGETLSRDLSKCAVYGRHGKTGPRDRETIGFETIRGGDIVGEHTVLFAGEGERIELVHRASSRMNFARGALRALGWIRDRENGLYDMQDVLGLR
jgi:4-hydroxy-tetrahydrodipicolinate reductase